MASFDLHRRRVCLRIVYDGAAGAGKSTNVRQLAQLFEAQLASRLYSPAEIEGRTLYFDWLQILGGVSCGFPLVCQVLSVPGQQVLDERRRHLLATADAVVYVCDSAEHSIDRDGAALADLQRSLAARAQPPVLLVQANKQDALGALAGPALLDRLGLPDAICVEAIARDAIGVVDTFVNAVRAVTRSLQQSNDAGELALDVTPPQQAGELLAALEQVPVDPEWAAEMFLEEVSRALREETATAGALQPAIQPAPSIAGNRVPTPRTDAPHGCVWPAHTARGTLEAIAAHQIESVRLDATGAAEVQAGAYRLHVSTRRRFDNDETGRGELVRAARAWSQLGALRSPHTALVLQPASDGAFWLWTILPVLPAADAWLEAATDDTERTQRAERIAAARAELTRFATDHQLLLDTAHLGVEDNGLRYVGDLEATVT